MIPDVKRDSEHAYDRLVELILSGDISEDQALSERRLSELLKLGRTPIREAVKGLARDGVLESHPTRGTILRPLSLSDLQDLYEIRFAIEGLAAFLAAERGETAELRPYAEAFEATLRNPEACDIAAIHDHGVAFHFEIMRLAGNRRLQEMYRPFRLRFRVPFAIVRKNNPERVLAAVAEHIEIAEAIMARKTEQARDLMCSHLRKGLDYRTEMLLKRSRYSLSSKERAAGADNAEAADE